MLTQYPYSRNYLFTALSAGPELFERLLVGTTADEADRRPDPGRFTIREVMAHLADWEDVFQGRIRRMLAEDFPTIEGYDEGQRAIDNNYAATDPPEQTRVFAERRAETVSLLRSLESDQWDRAALRPEIGAITVEAQATLMALHDTYHLKQVADWLDRT